MQSVSVVENFQPKTAIKRVIVYFKRLIYVFFYFLVPFGIHCYQAKSSAVYPEQVRLLLSVYFTLFCSSSFLLMKRDHRNVKYLLLVKFLSFFMNNIVRKISFEESWRYLTKLNFSNTSSFRGIICASDSVDLNLKWKKIWLKLLAAFLETSFFFSFKEK